MWVWGCGWVVGSKQGGCRNHDRHIQGRKKRRPATQMLWGKTVGGDDSKYRCVVSLVSRTQTFSKKGNIDENNTYNHLYIIKSSLSVRRLDRGVSSVVVRRLSPSSVVRRPPSSVIVGRRPSSSPKRKNVKAHRLRIQASYRSFEVVALLRLKPSLNDHF